MLIISIPIDTDLLQRKPLLLRSVLSVFQNFFFPECGVYLLKKFVTKVLLFLFTCQVSRGPFFNKYFVSIQRNSLKECLCRKGVVIKAKIFFLLGFPDTSI